jgi:hypothetical protein
VTPKTVCTRSDILGLGDERAHARVPIAERIAEVIDRHRELILEPALARHDFSRASASTAA